MQISKIIRESWEVNSRLASLSLSKQELISAAIKAATARNDAVIIDPINAPGLLGYIYGTRAIREMLLPKQGWKVDRSENIEATINTNLNTKIIYQNVDIACSTSLPRAISGKGNATRRLIDSNQPFLWPEMEDEFNAEVNTSVWFFCVSLNGDDLRAELSRPSIIEGNQFGNFLERIFIITHNDSELAEEYIDDESQDFEVEISRR